MLVAAVLPVTMDDTGETDRTVVSPESGVAFLLAVRRIGLIEDVTGAGGNSGQVLQPGHRPCLSE